MNRKRIVIAGTNFAGYTAALELKELVGENHDVVVVANTHKFLFFPSLIWYPFGLREEKDITFDVRPIYESHGIQFIEGEIDRFDPPTNQVVTREQGPVGYDYLVIGTGPKVDYDYIPGLREHAYSIVGLGPAHRTREGWQKFLADPGPVVIGAAQGAACFGAAYEFLFNTRYQLAKNDLADQAPLTYVTAEPFAAHFGIGGFGNAQKMCEWMFKHYHIHARLSAEIDSVTADGVHLKDGEFLPSKFTMIVPRFLGVDAVRNTPGLANPAGFIEVDDTYQHPVFRNVFAAGVAVHVRPPGPTAVPCGVPKTGWPTEQMAKLAVKNIVADIKGLPFKAEKFGEMASYCIMDTGNMGMMIVGDHMLSPREHEFIIPGPEAHWAKLAFEKYFLWTRRHAHV
ncbi:MAG: FAD-dependent oxidoreductase [Acidobacteria bacterium]|nr:FAD-dependent oxidoreductase [Acidobacteriota bacterium]